MFNSFNSIHFIQFILESVHVLDRAQVKGMATPQETKKLPPGFKLSESGTGRGEKDIEIERAGTDIYL